MDYRLAIIAAVLKRFASKYRVAEFWIARVVIASALGSVSACTPSAAQKSDEKVCEELVIAQTISMAIQINHDSTLKEIISSSSLNVDPKALIKDAGIQTAIIQKQGVQVSCRVALDLELMIDSRDPSLESDLYVGSTEFDVLFSRTPQQSVIIKTDVIDKVGAWVIQAWFQYVGDQARKRAAK